MDAAKAEPAKYGRPPAKWTALANRRGVSVTNSSKEIGSNQARTASAAGQRPLSRHRCRPALADERWRTRRIGEPPIPSMSPADICAMKVASMAYDNCIMWLWTTNAFLPDAFDVLEAWGFEYKTTLTWVKQHFGTGDRLRGKPSIASWRFRKADRKPHEAKHGAHSRLIPP